MGYKSKAVHLVGTYSTDCKCKQNRFAQFREARIHCDGCTAGALHVIYHERAGGERIVYDRDTAC